MIGFHTETTCLRIDNQFFKIFLKKIYYWPPLRFFCIYKKNVFFPFILNVPFENDNSST